MLNLNTPSAALLHIAESLQPSPVDPASSITATLLTHIANRLQAIEAGEDTAVTEFNVVALNLDFRVKIMLRSTGHIVAIVEADPERTPIAIMSSMYVILQTEHVSCHYDDAFYITMSFFQEA